MGLFDIVKGVAKAISNDVKWKRKVLEEKEELLYRFSTKQLREIARREHVNIRGLKYKDDIIQEIFSQVPFKKLIEYAKRYNIRYKDIINELEEFKKQLENDKEQNKNKSKKQTKKHTKKMKTENKIHIEKETETDKILKIISEFEPVGIIRDERELKVQLVQWLQAKIGKRNVRTEYQFEHGKIDILVNDEIAIEIKIAKSRQVMKNLIGEIQTDKMYFTSVITVIFDIGKNIGLDFYVNQIQSIGARTIIIPTQIKTKGKRKEIIVNDGRRKIIIR